MKIIKARPLSEFRLELSYESGETGVVDLASLVGKGVFVAWTQPGVFEQVRVTAYGAVEWPGEIDLCPDALYLQMTGKKPDDIFPSLAGRPSHA